MKRIALTGGIACGKSLAARFLNACGVRTLDADDIVHELIPVEERKRLAAIVFRDPAARQKLEAKIHPLVRARLREWMAEGAAAGEELRVAIIPLLFEVGWEKDYDEVWCLASQRETQIRRMMETRGYTRDEAEGRLAAQMDVAEKVPRSDHAIWNEGTSDELRAAVFALVKESKSH